MTYERPNIRRLTPYTPGEQPQLSAAADPTIKLNTNENPYPPAATVLEAIREITRDELRRYPSPTANRFCDIAARIHGLNQGHVIATNGGDELIRLAMTAFCDPRSTGGPSGVPSGGGGVGYAEPSYSLYPVLAEIHDTPVTTVDLDDNFALTTDFADRLLSAGCKLVIVVNPQAPSGRLETTGRLHEIASRLRGRAVLLIDEAYVDFAPHDCLPLLAPDSGLDNVLILRSLSKGYSLAGLRFGYGLGHPDLITTLHKARDSYNTDALSQAAAVAALEHRAEASKTWQLIRDERDRVSQALTDRRFRVYPSQTNFILAAPSGPAVSIYQALKKRRILVRYFDLPRLSDKLRITIGTPDQNNSLLAAIDDLGC